MLITMLFYLNFIARYLCGAKWRHFRTEYFASAAQFCWVSNAVQKWSMAQMDSL